MPISSSVESILVKRGRIFECCFIGGESIEPFINIERKSFLDAGRMVASCIYVKRGVVFLPERPMLTFDQVKGHVEVIYDLLVTLNLDLEAKVPKNPTDFFLDIFCLLWGEAGDADAIIFVNSILDGEMFQFAQNI